MGIDTYSAERIPVVLVVDDDWMNREVLEAHLTGAGYEVMVVHSGEKALEAAAKTPPDLVLLDVRMQGMSGYDLAREGSGTRVTIYNVLEGHGPGKLIAPLALRSARKGADDFGKTIKTAVEAS